MYIGNKTFCGKIVLITAVAIFYESYFPLFNYFFININ